MNSKPISPKDLNDKKINAIPYQAIDVFNYLIEKNYSAGKRASSFGKNEAMNQICSLIPNTSEREIDEAVFSHIYDLYRANGWIVREICDRDVTIAFYYPDN